MNSFGVVLEGRVTPIYVMTGLRTPHDLAANWTAGAAPVSAQPFSTASGLHAGGKRPLLRWG